MLILKQQEDHGHSLEGENARVMQHRSMCNEMVLEQFDKTVQWMNGLLSELKSFGTSLSSFITHCEESSDDAPQDFHHLYLLRLALDDVLNLPGGE